MKKTIELNGNRTIRLDKIAYIQYREDSEYWKNGSIFFHTSGGIIEYTIHHQIKDLHFGHKNSQELYQCFKELLEQI